MALKFTFIVSLIMLKLKVIEGYTHEVKIIIIKKILFEKILVIILSNLIKLLLIRIEILFIQNFLTID